MAIKHLGGNKFSFSCTMVGPMYSYGQNPVLDNLGATNHLTPTKKYDDIKAFNWIKNNTKYNIKSLDQRMYDIIELDSDEDALHFKMVWL
ncbi:MAG: hypothetical protein HC836_35560 [Richelia sp. RM2_1_2]|nr:hypothetical protein [Richelia sp. RM2_1_2]